MRIVLRWAMFILLASGLFSARANNLVLTNLALVNVSGGAADVQFDAAWENSWRLSWTDNGGTVGVTNWDAVWVFAKYRFSGSPWKHLLLAETGHAVPGGFVLSPATNDGLRLGAILHRAAEGSGPVTAAALRLHWDYAAAEDLATSLPATPPENVWTNTESDSRFETIRIKVTAPRGAIPERTAWRRPSKGSRAFAHLSGRQSVRRWMRSR